MLWQGFIDCLQECQGTQTYLRVFANPKVKFTAVIAPHCEMTASTVTREDIVLSVGDTTFLDYRKILVKQDGYGPQGKGGNGLAKSAQRAKNVQVHFKPLLVMLFSQG
jgi:hypothetical protein